MGVISNLLDNARSFSPPGGNVRLTVRRLRKDIEIVFDDGVLTVKGERKENDSVNRTYFAREIGSGDFSRAFRLPNNVDPSKVAASYKEGLLTIEIPKREEAKPRRIVVE